MGAGPVLTRAMSRPRGPGPSHPRHMSVTMTLMYGYHNKHLTWRSPGRSHKAHLYIALSSVMWDIKVIDLFPLLVSTFPPQ